MSLSLKHQQFINEYLTCWNATDAYRRVYPKCSYDTARANGADLLANTSIYDELQKRVRENTMGADEVLVRIGEQARGAHSRYIRTDGTVDIAGIVENGKAHLIKKVKDVQFGREYEFYDSQAALTLIARHHSLFVDKSKVDLNVDVKNLPDEELQRIVDS